MTDKKKKIVKVVYDRRKTVATKGVAAVEIVIQVNRYCRKYITYETCTPAQWKKTQKSAKLRAEIAKYESIASLFLSSGCELTVENLNMYLGCKRPKKTPEAKARVKAKAKAEPEVAAARANFLDFVRDRLQAMDIRPGTRRQKLVMFDALVKWGGMRTFSDVTSQNLKRFDAWLRTDKKRHDVGIHNYHKNLRIFCRMALEEGYIDVNPYNRAKFPRGKCKTRNPLTEEELHALRDADLDGHVARARDLFVFAANCGLAYCDTMNFDFKKMAVKRGDLYYINAQRIKTGSDFYTPILPDGMAILERYDYQLPRMSNQKANDYLKIAALAVGITKNVTFHLARHTFATLMMTYNVPVDKVARMLGHQDIKTTQIYAKTLNKSIEDQAERLLMHLGMNGKGKDKGKDKDKDKDKGKNKTNNNNKNKNRGRAKQ